jgi:ABC-type phosphate transport system substrate-binding protein
MNRKREMLKRSIACAAVAATALIGSMSGAASAATSQVFPGYGFDGNAHLVVGGGSTTLYKLGQSLASLWNSTASCATNNANNNAQSPTEAYPPAATTSGAAYNECLPSSQAYDGVFAGGNYDGDTVAIAAPTGSSDGIASLNGDHGTTTGNYAYEGVNANLPTTDNSPLSGYSNGYGTVDFALSSRAAKTTGGNCPLSGPTGNANDELKCDTFWGIASDGVEIITSGSRAGLTPGHGAAPGAQLTAPDLYNIWDCTYTNWNQIPGLKLASGPIVPWGMNSGSGTYADFINYLEANGGAPSTFTPDEFPCDRPLSSGQDPLENDIKPLVNDAATAAPSTGPYSSAKPGLSTRSTSVNNPSNWIWFGSYGLLSAFPYLSQYTYSGKGDGGSPYAVSTLPAPVYGITPSPSTIFQEKYPILRILNLVTTKADATCPLNASNVCNFTLDNPPKNGNGVTDINVEGANTGVGGAVRELVRFVCRKSAGQEPTDPYTGVNELTEIGAAIASSGFEPIPTSLRSTGSSCDVKAYG